MKKIGSILSIFLLIFLGWGLFSPFSLELFLNSVDDLETIQSTIPVSVSPARVGPITNSLTMSSVVEAKHFVQVFPARDGIITKVVKKNGEPVKKGELIAQLQRDTLELDIEQQKLVIEALRQTIRKQKIQLQQKIKERTILELEVKNALDAIQIQKERVAMHQQELKRSERLLANNSLSKQKYIAAQFTLREAIFALDEKKVALSKSRQALEVHPLAVQLAESSVDEIQNTIEQENVKLQKMMVILEKTNIKAKIAGILTNFNIHMGKKVVVSQEIFSIVSLQNLQVYVDIPQRHLAYIKERQDVQIYHEVMSSDLQKKFHGKVSLIHPIIDKHRGTALVTIDILPQYIQHFRPGMLVTAKIIIDHHKSLVLIPKKARLFENGVPFVYVLKDQRAHKVFLGEDTVVTTDKYYYGIRQKITPGDFIVVSGQARLQSQSVIHIEQRSSLFHEEWVR